VDNALRKKYCKKEEEKPGLNVKKSSIEEDVLP
jgi:hypothetical protein